MEPARQHRFARPTAPGDHHTAQAGVHRRQQEGRLGGVMAGERGQGKGLASHGSNTSKRSRAGVAGNHGGEVLCVEMLGCRRGRERQNGSRTAQRW